MRKTRKPSEQELKLKAEKKKLTESVAFCFNSEQGVHFLRHLKKYCGQDISSTVFNNDSGKLMTESVIHNEAMRAVYLHIRDLLPNDIYNKVEQREI